MLCFVVATFLAVQQPPPPPPQDTTRRDTSKVKLDSLPLKTDRTVSFETSEGTWISLDVSPDGKTIVFELSGDLYTMPVTGGAATRITSGPAFDSQPRWSPDGKRLVFLSDRSGAENIWLCDPDGSHSKALTKATNNLYASPDWTPDGKYIVVSRTSGVLGSVYELWLIHKDGGSGAAMLRVQAGPNQPPPMNTLGAAFGRADRDISAAVPDVDVQIDPAGREDTAAGVDGLRSASCANLHVMGRAETLRAQDAHPAKDHQRSPRSRMRTQSSPSISATRTSTHSRSEVGMFLPT